MASLWSLETTPRRHLRIGEIDLAGAEDFVEEFCTIARDAPRPLLADMTGVTFLDSSGIVALTRLVDILKPS